MKKITLLMLCILMLAGTSYGGTLYLVSKTGTGWSGQTSGNTGFTTVTPVNLSSPSQSFNAWYAAATFASGDAVWVLSDASAYNLTAAIAIKANGKIYGGFAGTETTSTIGTGAGRQLNASPSGNWDLANSTVFNGVNTYQGFTGGSGSMIIDGLTVQNCYYNGAGSAQAAGISCSTSTTVQNCIVTGCTSAGTASAGSSSGVALSSGAKLLNSYIHHNTFSNTTGYGGGAVSIAGHANYESQTPISGCKISDNTNNGTTTYAGGIFMYSGLIDGFKSTIISNCNISNNTTVGQGGGIGIYIANFNNTANTTPLVISGCTINNNTTTYASGATGGGGIFFNNTTPTNTNNNVTVQNSTLFGNIAAVGTTSKHGGAINSTGNITLNNCVIASNTGTNVIYMGIASGVSATVQNCTFANNVDAQTTPAAVPVLYSNVPATASAFTNTIIYNQTASPLNVSTGQKPITTYCGFDASVSLASAPYNGIGNIKTIASTSFVNAASNDYHLASGSTAINAGTVSAISGCSPDRDGMITRPQGSASDMGAYEAIYVNIVASGSNGVVTGASATAVVGQSITVNATPNTGYRFVNWTESGTPVSTNASFTFTVSTARTLVANFEAATTISSGTTNVSTIIDNSIVTVASGAEITVGANKTLKSVTVAAGGKITITAGTLTTTDGITLESDANGTATLLNSGTLTSTVTAKQFLGSARNWYVSSPISSAPSPATNVEYYYEYMEGGTNTVELRGGQPGSPTDYWKGISNGTTMAVGKGYIAKTTAGTTVLFSGTPNNGDITTTFDLTRDDNKGKGFNLVGNPYTSYLDWSLVATANPNLDNTYYYRTKNTNITNTYTFVTWNGAGSGSFVVSNGSLPANTSITRHIPPTQAFWVRVKTGTITTKMNFNNGMREHRLDNNNLMKAPKQNTRTNVRLQLQNGTDSDELLIYQDAEASNGYDAYDSPKMMNNSTTVPDLYSKAGDERLVINGLNTLTNNTELPLGFSLNAAATLKLKATELSNLPEGAKVYLRDKQLSTETELTPATEYSFSTTAATTNNETRFSLLFRAPGATTATANVEKERISVFVNKQNQITIIAKAGSPYAIYNAMGQLIENGTLNSGLQTANCKLQTGILVVKVNNQSTRVVAP